MKKNSFSSKISLLISQIEAETCINNNKKSESQTGIENEKDFDDEAGRDKEIPIIFEEIFEKDEKKIFKNRFTLREFIYNYMKVIQNQFNSLDDEKIRFNSRIFDEIKLKHKDFYNQNDYIDYDSLLFLMKEYFFSLESNSINLSEKSYLKKSESLMMNNIFQL